MPSKERSYSCPIPSETGYYGGFIKSIRPVDEDPIEENYSPSPFRWLILVLAGLLLFGRNYNYDTPAAVKGPLSNDLVISESQYSLLFSVYSLPNIFLPFLGGFLIDKYGTSSTMGYFTLICMIGSLLSALGVQFRVYWILLCGRILFGLGGECISVGQTKIVAKCFFGGDLALALGVTLFVERLGSVITELLSPLIYTLYGTDWVFWISFISSLASSFCCIFIILMEKILRPPGIIEKDPELKVGDAFKLNKQFWILSFVICFLYGTVIPFIVVESSFLQSFWYKGDPQKAGQTMSIPDGISSFCAPIFGILVDKIGWQGHICVFSSISMALIHLALGFYSLSSPIIPLCLLGLIYTIYSSAVWPAVVAVTPEKHWGLAYGVATSILNASCALFPLIVSFIAPNWWAVELFFIFLSIIALIFSLALEIVDYLGPRTINLTEPERELKLKQSKPLESDEELMELIDISNKYRSHTVDKVWMLKKHTQNRILYSHDWSR
eukprot:NODE_2026_length_1713_cov_43.933333_g1731_i0.p1 GENE.NODE_2026_length_1713_cov_43.933333_g1731_i0~~NODE_2026_length_1713_cov_43.933333_g1731_i0.p1  ORF type:complete len:498 (+),score=54.34 NODE_2026_length_1713_cov_43.933333_g1731_i0:76-1569(+)